MDAPEDRYVRQQLFLPGGAKDQERLTGSSVLLVGCGALGTTTALLLGRAGVGRLLLVDRDFVEWSNLQRQSGFDESDARHRRAKAEALASRLGEINATVDTEPLTSDFNYTNALELARGVDLVLDGTDNLPTRFLINDVSYKLGVPWIYCGAVGDTAHAQFFSGTDGPCLRCQLPELPPPGTIATCDTNGVIGPAATLAAAWQSAMALRYLVERRSEPLAGRKAMFSPWNLTARVVGVRADPDCQVCFHGSFDSLAGELSERVTNFCGRNSVQVLPAAGATRFDLGAAADRLQSLGSIARFPRFLRVQGEGFELTLFADGRAVFDGLTDHDAARSLYARFVGA